MIEPSREDGKSNCSDTISSSPLVLLNIREDTTHFGSSIA